MKSLIIACFLLLSGKFHAQSAAPAHSSERKEMKQEQPQQEQNSSEKSNAYLMSKELKVTVQPEAVVPEPKTGEKAQRTERTPQY